MEIDKREIPHLLSGKLKGLPRKPGVYQYKNKAGKVIYVGKAINLRSRVASYFSGKGPADAKTKAMLAKAEDIDIIVTDSEAEALILEDTLIKKLKPKYNILLKDDKTYPMIRITNEEYPRIFITRNIVNDGSRYIGPFTDVRQLRQVMKLARSLFYLRSCDYNISDETIEKKKYKVCLDYHISKCEGPCEGLVSRMLYNNRVRAAIDIINGKTRNLELEFTKEMEEYAEALNYEEAAKSRNKLLMLRNYTEKQKMVSRELIDRDIIGLARIDDSACSLVLKVRDGKLIGKRHFIISDSLDRKDEEIIQLTLEKWYLENEFIPKEIYVPSLPEQSDFLIDWLRKKRGSSLIITVPQKGDKKKLVQMAALNADYILREFHLAMLGTEHRTSRAVLSLQRDLRLEKPPLRIECFDNSHIQGSDYVSSVVVFVDGKPKKNDYRKFKMKTIAGNDDFAAMREVLRRRYKSLEETGEHLPDLIVIDGGKGQLSSAVGVLNELNLLSKIKVIGLAKRLEEVFIPDAVESVLLPRTSGSLRLLQHLRDEAHRFAISYHRTLRKKRTLQTELTEIPGVGRTTAIKLLTVFGSVENISKCTTAELEPVVGAKLSLKIIEYFSRKTNE